MLETEAALEEQIKEAKEKLKNSNNEFRVISRNLVDGKLSEAGALLSKYKKSSDHAELVSFFAEKPPLVKYELAQVYRKGLGVEADLEAALTWYRQAGEAGHAKAQTMLGFLYRNGIGVEADLKQAVQWYQRATEQGEPTALFNLGSLYRKGYGVPQNEAKALELYREAAGKGNAQAKQMLRKMEG